MVTFAHHNAKGDRKTHLKNLLLYVGPNLMGRLLMELRDGTMEYKLPEDWNKALVIINYKNPVSS